MTNEEKAEEIMLTADCIFTPVTTAVKKAALEMAKWKDEQFKEILSDTYDIRKKICRSDKSFLDAQRVLEEIIKN